jgi:plasmid stability protein
MTGSDVIGDASIDMRGACVHASCMSRMLQVRNVPEALHRRLKMRAAGKGQTLTDYVLDVLKRADREPSIEEWLEELRALPATRLSVSPAALIRKARKAR